MSIAPLSLKRETSLGEDVAPARSAQKAPKLTIKLPSAIEAPRAADIESIPVEKDTFTLVPFGSEDLNPIHVDPSFRTQILEEVRRSIDVSSSFLGKGESGTVYPFMFDDKMYAAKVLYSRNLRSEPHLREFKFSHLLDKHPNLANAIVSGPVIIGGAGHAYRAPCLVMEHIPGKPLIDHLLKECESAEPYTILNDGDNLSEKARTGDDGAYSELQRRIENLRSLTRDIASALSYLHAQKLVHRDVKPENIMIAPSEEGSIKHVLYDYGTMRSPETADGVPRQFNRESFSADGCTTPCGTDYYRSPESHRAASRFREVYSYPTDIWSLGTCIYCAAFGMFPYETVTGDELRKDEATATHKLTPVDLPKDAPAQLKDLLARCFDADPTKRITADEILKHPFLAERDDVMKYAACEARVEG